MEKIEFLSVHGNTDNMRLLLQWMMQRGGGFLLNALLFAVGAIALRSAGCIFNDLCDVAFDQKVRRTKDRPLAAGFISRKEAWGACLFSLIIGGIVWLVLPFEAKGMSLLGLLLLFIYPYAKRFLKIPQIILGLAFNMGVLVSVAFLQPSLLLKPYPWILYGVGLFWTLYYDTLYAIQDINDDRSLGIGSSALFLKNT